MTALAPEQVVEMVEVGVILMGIAIIWAVYHNSDRAELPGDARVPDPGQADDAVPDMRGRTL